MHIRWTRPALHHLEEIQDYIAQESPLAAYRLAHDLVGAHRKRIDDNAQNGPIRSCPKYPRTRLR